MSSTRALLTSSNSEYIDIKTSHSRKTLGEILLNIKLRFCRQWQNKDGKYYGNKKRSSGKNRTCL